MSRSKGYIEELIAQGEHEHQDFKHQISDAKKIARSISAFANHSGGHLLVGVKDNGRIAGVSSDEEAYMVEQAATMYCKPPQSLQWRVYRVEGKNVLKVDIAEATEKPVLAPDEHGQWRAYFRVNDENILASATHVKVMNSQREEEPAEIVFTESEHLLLDYLATHGGITLSGYARLAHISREAAQRSVVDLCQMNVLRLTYHNNQCLIVAAD